jgi:hypothetical protein
MELREEDAHGECIDMRDMRQKDDKFCVGAVAIAGGLRYLYSEPRMADVRISYYVRAGIQLQQR